MIEDTIYKINTSQQLDLISHNINNEEYNEETESTYIKQGFWVIKYDD